MLDKFLKTIEKITPVKWHWILNHDGFKRYFANTGWMFFGQIFSLLVSFFIGAWLARYLGPENYGIFNYSLAFAGLFGFIASLGIDGILSRELVRFPEKRDLLLGTAFCLKIFGGFITFILVILSALLFQTNLLIKLLIISFSFSFILQSINVISTYFQAEVKSKNNVKALLIATIISSLLKIAVILLDRGVIWIVIVHVLDFLWQGLGFIGAYRRFGLKIRNWQFNKKLAYEILKNSWPLMIASAAGIVYLKIDQVLIGYMLGDREVGIYAAAIKFVEIWYFIPGIVCVSLFPAIVNAKKAGNLIYRKRLNMLYKLMIVSAIGVILFSTILAPFVIKLFFGKEYFESISILKVYVWSSIGFFVSFGITQYFLMENRTNYIFFFNFFVMIINIIFNLLLIPHYGLIGAAYATLVSYSFGPIIFLVINFKNKLN